LSNQGWYTSKVTGKSAYLNTTLVYVPPDLVMIHADDITERKQAEMLYRRVNRSLAALSGSNEAIIKATSVEELFNSVCQVLVEKAGYRLAWIGEALHSKRKDVLPVAQAGFEEGYLDTLDLSWDDIKRGQGPTGVSIRTRKPCISQDITNDPKFKPWREDAITRGYASSISLPLRLGEDIFGSLGIYAEEPNAFDADEVELLEKMSNSLSHAIETFRKQEIAEIRRRQAEADVEFERARLVSILDALDDGIYVVDKNYEIEYINHVIENEVGQVAGRKCYAYLHDRSEPCPWCKNEEVFAGNSVRWEWYSERNNRYYDLLDTPIKNADGSISKFEIFRDITESKLAAQTLAKSERQHKNAQALAHIGHWEYDVKTDNAFWSDELYSIFEIDKKAGVISAEQFLQHIHLDDRETIRKQIESGSSYRSDYRVVMEDGSIKHIHEEVNVVQGEDGKIVSMSGTAQDITQRKKTENILLEERERAQSYLDLARVMFVAIDATGVVTLANKKSSEVLGYPEEEIVGVDWFDTFMPQRFREDMKEVSKQILRGDIEPVEYYENPILLKNGTERLIAWNNAYLRDDEGSIIGHLSSGEDITERKKMESELILAEKEWRKTFDSMTDLASIHDNEFRILKVNKAFAEHLGKNPSELEGKTCYELLHDTKEPWPNCPYVRTLESGKSATEEVDDSNIGIPLLVSTSPILDEHGNIERVVHIARDTSSIKQSQKYLEESENRYRVLVEASFEGIFIHIDFIIQTVNQQVADMLDSSIPDLIGNSIVDWFTPESKQLILENFHLNQNDPYIIKRIRDDGSIQFIETIGRPCTYEGLAARIVAFTDITERVTNEEAIVTSEKRYRNLYERMEDGFTISDKDGKYIAYNKAYLRMLGYNETDLVNKSFSDITPEKWHETDEIIFQTQVQVVGHSQLYEKELIKKDGSLVPIEVRVHMSHNEEGEPVGTWTLIRDISQRKMHGIEMQRSTEAALLYLDIMGHDIRNHLQAIVMATEIMSSYEMDPEFASVYDIITESVENS
ncbi:MAG: PAS domain S-box protein, partial [Candidatus Thorarchaeota archaeon]